MITHVSICKHPEGVKVNPHLAITLPELERRRNAGQAISAMDYSAECSFSGNCVANFPIEFTRDVTINKIYEQGMKSKAKIEKYGRQVVNQNQSNNG